MQEGWNIIRGQPANSSDFCVLGFEIFQVDLGYSASIRTIDDLIKCVEESFEQLSWKTVNIFFLFLQMAMESLMRCGVDTSWDV